MPETNYIEANALLAAQTGDLTAVDRELAKLTYTELADLAKAASTVHGRCRTWMRSGGADLTQ